MKWGTKTRGNENEGETYQVRTRSELTGVVSERVLTPGSIRKTSWSLSNSYNRLRGVKSIKMCKIRENGLKRVSQNPDAIIIEY